MITIKKTVFWTPSVPKAALPPLIVKSITANARKLYITPSILVDRATLAFIKLSQAPHSSSFI